MWMFVIAFLVFVFSWIWTNCRRSDRYPPGPIILPFIGTWYAVPPRPRAVDVAPQRKKYGNIIGHKIGSYNIVFVSGYDEIIKGLKHPNIQGRINSEYWKSRSFDQRLGFFFGDGERSAKVRAASLRYLGTLYNEHLSEVMDRELNVLFKSIKSGAVHDMDSNFMDLPLNLLCSILIGPDIEEHRSTLQTIKKLTNKGFIYGRNLGIESLYPFMRRFINAEPMIAASVYTHKFLQKCIREQKKSYDPSCIRNYIDFFMAEAEKEKLRADTNYFTDEELCTCMLDLLQAGNESTGHTILFVLLHVALHPEIQKKIHEELDSVVGRNRKPDLQDKTNLQYIQAVINETSRINVIAPIAVLHRVIEDTEFYEYKLPKDTLVAFSLDDVLMNPEYWNDPKKFDPDRFLIPDNRKKLINFGLGARGCLGEILAKNTVFLFITRFFHEYEIELPKGLEKPTTESREGLTMAPHPYKLIIKKRN